MTPVAVAHGSAPQSPSAGGKAPEPEPFPRTPGGKLATVAVIALYLMGTLVYAGYVLLVLWPTPVPTGVPPPSSLNVTVRPFPTVTISEEVRIIALVLMAGAIGSCAYGLFAEFIHIARRDFSFRWTLWYVARPFIGAFFGLMFYLALRAGLFSTGAPLTELNVFGFTALAAIVGMFSEETLAKFKLIAESFLTKAEFMTEDYNTGEKAPAAGKYMFVEHAKGATCNLPHPGHTEDLKEGALLPAAPCGQSAVWMRLPSRGP